VLLLGVAAVISGLYSSASLVEFAGLAILVNFAIVPYALFYDYPSLVITLFYGNHLLHKHKWICYAANTLVMAGLFVGNIIPYRYWITVTLAVFLAVGYYLRLSKITTSPER
jgi:hypothetical protein